VVPTVNGIFSFLDVWLTLTPEISLERKLSTSLGVGMSLSYYNVRAVNGWDRYDSFETRKSFVLAHVFPGTVYLSVKEYSKAGSMKYLFGVQYPIFIETRTGEEADMEIDKSIFLGFSFE
jgi:hypothetical protein